MNQPLYGRSVILPIAKLELNLYQRSYSLPIELILLNEEKYKTIGKEEIFQYSQNYILIKLLFSLESAIYHHIMDKCSCTFVVFGYG